MIVYDMKYDVDIVISWENNAILRCIRYVLNLRFVLRRYTDSTNILESHKRR